MADIAHSCPQCGDAVPHRFPYCGRDQTPTPLYAEVNAVAQYLVGVPTYVEFRLFNAAERPLVLHRFDASIGGTLLGAGIHACETDMPIEPGETIIDRKVNLGLDQVTPGRYALRATATFSCAEGTFSMSGSVPVVFALPGAAVLDWISGETGETRRLGLHETLEWTGVRDVPFGEQRETGKQTTFIRSMKARHGLCFVPLRMDYDCATSGASLYYETECRNCGAELVEGGMHCHACGEAVALPQMLPAATLEETRAYCCHCKEPKGRLRGQHRFCPECGLGIPAHFGIKMASAYMEGVQGKAVVRFRTPSPAPVHFHALQVRLGRGETAVDCSVHDFWPGLDLQAGDGDVEWPVDVYCPHGARVGQRYLFVSADLEQDGRRMLLEGRREVRVIPSGDEKSITYNFGAQSVEAAESVVSGGAWNIRVDGMPAEGKREAFINTLLDTDWEKARFVPLRMRLAETRAVIQMPAPPACLPMDRARLFFTQHGMPHNYVLIAKRTVLFGRSAADCDVRLLEVETRVPLMRAQRDRGEQPNSGSAVSRVQWQLDVEPGGLVLTQRSDKFNTVFGGKGTLLQNGQRVRLSIGDAWEIPEALGLEVVRAAGDFPGRAGVFEKAAAVLRQADGAAASESWATAPGAYTLHRLHSLHGKYEGPVPECGGFEAYVLMPGWAAIGSGREADIRVEHVSVAPLHARILHAGGCFFIQPAGGATPVAVNGVAVDGEWPQPLAPGDTVRVGEVEMIFDAYKVLHLE